MKIRKNRIAVGIFILLVVSVFSFGVLGQDEGEDVGGGETASASDLTVCCTKTNSGLFCQDVKQEDCSGNFIQTSCAQTRECKTGWCFDSNEGTCSQVSQFVCNNNSGTWTEERPPACDFGCCYLDEEGAFVTLTRCKTLSGYYGLETKFDAEIQDAATCIATAGAKDKGACVYIDEFQRTCEFTTREKCAEGIAGSDETQAEEVVEERVWGYDWGLETAAEGTAGEEETSQEEGSTDETDTGENSGDANGDATGNGDVQTGPAVSGLENDAGCGKPVCFYAGMLCSADELQTNCAPTRDTMCVEGKQEVYFKDSCGNPANIYDASKINDDNYWSFVKKKDDSCNPADSNADSPNCGNCNYIYGSYCREQSSSTGNPTYGDFICADLNCVEEERMHGESWCRSDMNIDAKTGGINPVGTKFYRVRCNNGEIIPEPCADFRQEVCYENVLDTPQGPFSEAACRVNRWQDCTAQTTKEKCENSDVRDCSWLPGIEYVLMGVALAVEDTNEGSTDGQISLDRASLATLKQKAEEMGAENIPRGACVPKNAPGLTHWEGEESSQICAQAHAACPVTYEKGLIGGGWDCIENCFCDPKENPTIVLQRAQVCMALGDCGPKINIIGQRGSTRGFKISTEDLDEED